MSEVGKPAADAESAVHSLVHAIREALACGIQCTDESGSVLDSSQVDAFCNHSREAMACVQQIEQALLSSLEQPGSEEEGMEQCALLFNVEHSEWPEFVTRTESRHQSMARNQMRSKLRQYASSTHGRRAASYI